MSGVDDGATVAANSRVGVRLLASAVVFVFMAFVFAFLYLRALNSDGDFRPAHTNPSQGFGVAILVSVLAAAALFEIARRRLAGGGQSGWRSASGAALVLALAVVVLQIVEYMNLGFKTAGGGFASVFWGWTLAFLLFWLGAVYWVETLVASSARTDGEPESFVGPAADACAVYLWTVAAVAALGYVLLYLVK